MRALEREEIDGLLDDADDRSVTPLVAADPADLVFGQVAALAAETNAFLHVGDRAGERARLVLRRPQEVEREALRGARADPGQTGQLRDEVLDGGREHRLRLSTAVGWEGLTEKTA